MSIRRRAGTPVAIGAGEKHTLDLILAGVDGAGPAARRQHFIRLGAEDLADSVSAPADAPGSWEPPDAWLEDGQSVPVGDRDLSVIPAPGHTRGHVVF